MEHPDRTAVAQLYDSNRILADRLARERPIATHKHNWLSQVWHRFFDESHTDVVDLKPVRDQRIRLMNIAVGGATRLNSRSWSWRTGSPLDLDEDEIVTVVCETIRILMMEEQVRGRLNAIRLPQGERTNP